VVAENPQSSRDFNKTESESFPMSFIEEREPFPSAAFFQAKGPLL
jgi:hypothetical protein